MSNHQIHIEPELIENTHFDDLLFEGKNKAYGSYQMRKELNRNLIIGFIISFSFVLVGFSWPIIKKAFTKETEEPIKIKEKRVLNYSELSAPPPIELEKPLPEKINLPPKDIKKFLKPVVKKDEEVIDEELIPTMEELQTADAGTENIEGIDSINIEGVLEGFDELEEETITPFITVEQMPSFPGGEAELIKFLSDNIEYPTAAREAKVQGLVIARFVIDADGNIINIEILRGIGGGCDEEAIRVIQKMPKWNPGKQNGRAVPVIFNLPIRFKLITN